MWRIHTAVHISWSGSSLTYNWQIFSLPQPPHVTILVWEKAIRVITTVLDVDESTAEYCLGVIFRSRTRKSVYVYVGCVVVA